MKTLHVGWEFFEQPQIFPDHLGGTLEKFLYVFLLDEQSDGFPFIHNDQVRIGTASKAIFPRNLIDNQYLVSLGQSVEHYEWRFMPMNMTIMFTLPHNSFFISPTTMLSSTKVN